MEIAVEREVRSRNAAVAAANRAFFQTRGITAVNIMAAPGAGKTSLIEATLARLEDGRPVAVIEGDLAGTFDTDRLQAAGIPAFQINTAGGCHLDARMVARALEEFTVPPGAWLFVENVGNLICPVGYDLGEEIRVAVSSVSEGDDKPYKYPTIFQDVEALVVNKADLLPYVRFEQGRFLAGVRRLNPELPVFWVSCVTGEGLAAWVKWLRARAAAGKTARETDEWESSQEEIRKAGGKEGKRT